MARDIYGIKPEDRIYQGMIIAFDFSIEEIWPALICGAAIVPAPADGCRVGSELAEFLNESEVTALCCVPTLLATIDREIPTLRLIMVGGEACPQNLVERWAQNGRRMLNTYGPTEATVTATWGELKAGRPVTIGRAMPTYTIYLLDEERKPVPDGEVGEISIAGIGVARGYVNREELTQKSFIPDEFNLSNNPSGRIYCTGDLGRLTPEGEIEYLGRADTQVKVLGRRIELSEIESVLLESPEVEKTAASTWTSAGVSELVAYCQLRENSGTEPRDALHQMLVKQLPSYTVPAYIEFVTAIPLLPNGKIDRKQLPPPTTTRLYGSSGEFVAPESSYEIKVAEYVDRAFNLERVSVDDDFFKDLNGHSLIVARMVSDMRHDPQMAELGLSDIYKYPNVRALAGKVSSLVDTMNEEDFGDTDSESTDEYVDAANTAEYASGLKVWLCGLTQAFSLYIIAALLALLGMFVFNLTLGDLSLDQPDYLILAGLYSLSLVISTLLTFVVPIIFKWALLGRVKPGVHPLWGWFFLRWWLVEKVSAMAPTTLLSGTPLLNIYCRMMGSKIGRDCLIETSLLHVYDLIEIEDGTSIGPNTHIFGYSIHDGNLHLAPARISGNCFIGTNSVIMPGASMEKGTWLGDQSMLPDSQVIPEGERWSGSPAEREGHTFADVEELASAPEETISTTTRFIRNAGFVVAALTLILVPIIATLSSSVIMVTSYLLTESLWFLLAAPLAGIAFVVTLSLEVVLLKLIVLPRIDPGIYSVNSCLYMRKWYVDKLMEMSVSLTNSLYSTLYLPPLLRLLGAKIGKRAEISTISHITPSLLTIGEESFVADIASIGPLRTYNNRFSVARTIIGRRSFIGNASLVPGGVSVSDNSLLGVLSLSPKEKFEAGSTWLGSPAINFPRREESQKFSEELTFNPTPLLYAKRLSYEFFRVTLPTTFASFAIGTIVIILAWLRINFSIYTVLAILPAFLFAIGIGLTLFVVALKKILIGTYTPKVRPMWSTFVWRTELVTALYENVVVPALVGPFTGTPFAAVILRVLGAKIGRRCYIETTYLTEFDLVNVGDDSAIGLACSLQTHLFEDRVMKMSSLHVGNRCSIGPRAVVLYDSTLEDDAKLDALSLSMKGETIPGKTSWQGVPARFIGRRTRKRPLLKIVN